MLRLISALFCCLLVCCKSGSAGPAPLRVGMELTYPPFETKDQAGNPDGVSVKMAEALARDLGRPLQIVPMEFGGLIPALKTGNIDLVISSMTASDVRRQSIDFSDPYAFTALAVLTGKDSAIQSVDDLRKDGIRIAVKSSTTGESWTREHLPQAQCTAFENEAACVMEVGQGRADAFVYDQLSIYRYQKMNASTTRALLQPVREESWAVGMGKGQEELKKQVNAFIARFRNEGGFEELADQYLAEEKKALKEMGIPFILR